MGFPPGGSFCRRGLGVASERESRGKTKAGESATAPSFLRAPGADCGRLGAARADRRVARTICGGWPGRARLACRGTGERSEPNIRGSSDLECSAHGRRQSRRAAGRLRPARPNPRIGRQVVRRTRRSPGWPPLGRSSHVARNVRIWDGEFGTTPPIALFRSVVGLSGQRGLKILGVAGEQSCNLCSGRPAGSGRASSRGRSPADPSWSGPFRGGYSSIPHRGENRKGEHVLRSPPER